MFSFSHIGGENLRRHSADSPGAKAQSARYSPSSVYSLNLGYVHL